MSDQWVYLTAGGGRWHARGDCEALAKGQQDASDRGRSTHPVRRVPLREAGERVPCGWCAAVPPSVSTPIADSAVKQLRTDTEYERLFLDRVLGSMPELWDWTIESQNPITVAGRTYRVDFALTDGADRIAIEVDGEHKGPNAPTHDEWTRRQTALVSDGWEVLRFTNRQVRDEQEACRRELAVTVARLRERRRHRSTLPAPTPTPPLVQGARQEQGQRQADAPPAPPARSMGAAALVAVVAVLAVGGILLANQNGGGPNAAPTTNAATSGNQANTDDQPGGVNPDEAANGFLSCPPTHPWKGNINQSGEKIAHPPDAARYNDTKPERCFTGPSAAQAEGYREALR